MTWKDVNETWKVIYDKYPLWDDLKAWVHSVRSDVLASVSEKDGSSSQGLLRVLEEVQHRYGRWQDQQCLSIKRALQEHAIPGTGRVPLSKFYFTELGTWKPTE